MRLPARQSVRKMAEDKGGEVVLTYEALAACLGIDPQSARRRALRARWPKTLGNDGRARVRVPETVLPAVPLTVGEPVAPAVPATPDPELVAELRRRAEAAEALAGAEREARIVAQIEAAQAQGEVAGLREAVRVAEALAAEESRRAGEAVQEAAQAQREAAEARQVGEAAQAAQRAAEAQLEAWTAGGAIARAWRAFTRRP